MSDGGFHLRFERNEDDGSIVFFLRNEVRAALKAESETRVSVTMWRGTDPNTFTAPDIGNIRSANFRGRLARSAARKFGQAFDPKTDVGRKRIEQIEDDLGQVAAALERKPEGIPGGRDRAGPQGRAGGPVNGRQLTRAGVSSSRCPGLRLRRTDGRTEKSRVYGGGAGARCG